MGAWCSTRNTITILNHILLLDRYMEVLTPEGKVLLRNDKLRWQDLGGPPFPNEGLPATTSAVCGCRMEPACCSSAIFIRSVTGLCSFGSPTAQPIEHGVLQFLGLLLLAVPPALLFAGLAGYRMAYKVLLPLKNMALRAETITASHSGPAASGGEPQR